MTEGESADESGPVEPDKPRRAGPDPVLVVNAQVGGRPVTLEFTRHAVDRMETRGVTAEQVVGVFRHPDEKRLDTVPGRSKWGRWEVTPRRRLDVVFEPVSDDPRVYVIVSAMWGR